MPANGPSNLLNANCNTYETVSLGDFTIQHGTTPHDFGNIKNRLNNDVNCFADANTENDVEGLYDCNPAISGDLGGSVMTTADGVVGMWVDEQGRTDGVTTHSSYDLSAVNIIFAHYDDTLERMFAAGYFYDGTSLTFVESKVQNNANEPELSDYWIEGGATASF